MKLRLLAVSLVVLMIVPTTVWASLRTLGSIEAVGLASENALHVGVLLKDCEWEAVASSDGGRTWRLAKRAKLPASLAPLPARGEIRYQIVDGRLILRSDDSGATWSDISPWRFLGEAVRQDVDAEKKRFLAKYGHWLPQSEVWLFSFAGTVAGILSVGGWYSRKLQKEWMPPVALSLAAYCLFALGLFAAHAWFINWFCSEQWSYRLGHWDGGVSVPHWPMGLLLHLSGNGWLAPVTAVALFPATPLWGCLLCRQSGESRGGWSALASGIPVLFLLILLGVSSIPGIGRGWNYGIEAAADDRSDGAANAREPVGGETNRVMRFL